ncbi:kinase-like protein, partial [Hysterangium stoloniferum]
LVRLLGQGAFSSVWLAKDIDHIVENGGGKQGSKSLRDSTAQKSKRGDRTSHGLRPPPATTSLSGITLVRGQSVYFTAKEAVKGKGKVGELTNLVAVKMMECALCDTDNRTRISFVREVEVLRHISHPSIVSYLHHFSTPTHHCLVLEALQGGELFELIGQGDNHARMTEPLTRRIFGELCHAVGWMHSVGLVHRDVKLENILFTTNPFLLPAPALAVPPVSEPLIKLTDFGLARFIDPAAPLLTTRCGSEFYAAPEIILGRAYDGRQTDSWACGVVLYALATGTLPFDQHILGQKDTRRGYLMRIARGEYVWPPGSETHLASDGLKKVAGRLLVRDPAKRSRVADIWDEEWMRGDGAPASPI